MKLAYGRSLTERDFKKHGVDAVDIFIDTERSERQERGNMFQVASILSGRGDPVELALLSWGDLGYGVDLKRQRKKLEELGVTVTIVTEKPKRSRGRPLGSSTFAPNKEDDAAIGAAYHDDERTPKGVLNIARRRGYDVTWAQLRGRYGNRYD
ncbi:MAG: hypothetical protein AAF986_08240 [Pseudomonadota bacterium]